jgi:hypothetical protein
VFEEKEYDSHAEISNDEGRVRFSSPVQDVLGFKITMDDIVLVEVLNSGQDLTKRRREERRSQRKV